MELYLPASFADRGVTIPFSADSIQNARLRGAIPSRREFLLPGLSGGDGTYVVPYRALNDLVEFNLYDRALYLALKDLGTLSPMAIRSIAMDIDSQGYGGLDKTDAAKADLKAAEMVAVYNQCLLIVRALDLLSSQGTDLNVAILITPDGQRRARQQFGEYARANGTTADEIMGTLETWAKLIGAVGARGTEHPGYLLKLLNRLDAMSLDLSEYTKNEPPETQFLGKAIVNAASIAHEITTQYMESCWRFEDTIEAALRDANGTLRQLTENLETISWVLDGWERMIEDWNGASDSFRTKRRTVLEVMYKNIPILPKSILGGAQFDAVNKIREQQTGWVKENVDWRTSELDDEMLSRLSKFRRIQA